MAELRSVCGLHVDAFQWTGDLDALHRWCGERWPVSFNEVLSFPTGEPGRYLRVWCGSWIIRHEGRAWAIPNDLKCVLFDLFRSDPPLIALHGFAAPQQEPKG